MFRIHTCWLSQSDRQGKHFRPSIVRGRFDMSRYLPPRLCSGFQKTETETLSASSPTPLASLLFEGAIDLTAIGHATDSDPIKRDKILKAVITFSPLPSPGSAFLFNKTYNLVRLISKGLANFERIKTKQDQLNDSFPVTLTDCPGLSSPINSDVFPFLIERGHRNTRYGSKLLYRKPGLLR